MMEHSEIKKMSRAIVRNIVGTSKSCYANTARKYGYKSFMDMYRQETKSGRKTCCALGCSGLFEVGAHVRAKSNGPWYIVPFCKSHNGYDEVIPLTKRTKLLPLNQKF